MQGFIYEDELWTPTVLCNAEKVMDLKYRYYNNRLDNDSSITRNPALAEKRARDRLEISKMLGDYFDKKENSVAFYEPSLN